MKSREIVLVVPGFYTTYSALTVCMQILSQLPKMKNHFYSFDDFFASMSSITTFLFFVLLLIVSLSLPPINRVDVILEEETYLHATKVMKARVLEPFLETTTYVDEGSPTTIPTTLPSKKAEKTTYVDETTPAPEETTTCVDDENSLQTTTAPTKPTEPSTPTPTTSKPPPSPSATPVLGPTDPAPQPSKSESFGGPPIRTIIGATAAIFLLILGSSIISIIVMWIVHRKKKKIIKATKTEPTKTSEDKDVEVDPKKTIFSSTTNSELRPYHIPPDKFTYKGPIVLHNAMISGPKEHRFAQQKSRSIKAVEWDDAANEAYEIGSKIEQIQDVAPEEVMSTMPSKSENVNVLEEVSPLEIAPPAPPPSTNTTTRHRTKQGKTNLKKTRKSTSKSENKRLKKPSFGPRKKRQTADQQ